MYVQTSKQTSLTNNDSTVGLFSTQSLQFATVSDHIWNQESVCAVVETSIVWCRRRMFFQNMAAIVCGHMEEDPCTKTNEMLAKNPLDSIDSYCSKKALWCRGTLKHLNIKTHLKPLNSCFDLSNR